MDGIARAITPRTRLILVDHIASASAVVMPLPAIVALARAHGIPVLVDGAHGPGMLDLDVDAIGADWYVGNCHKWLASPKGSAFIAASANPAWEVHPTVISHSYGMGFAAEFDKIGTRDYAPWLATPAAIAFHARLGGPGAAGTQRGPRAPQRRSPRRGSGHADRRAAGDVRVHRHHPPAVG